MVYVRKYFVMCYSSRGDFEENKSMCSVGVRALCDVIFGDTTA